MGNSQKTSNPYSADSLQPRDTELVWAREFQTEVTGETGEAFGDLIPTDVIAVEPRIGFAGVSSIDGPDNLTVRGTTFLTPEWSTYKTSPLGGGAELKFIAVYAKLRMYFEVQGPPSEPVAYLVFGQEGLVGQANAEPFGAVAMPATPQGGARMDNDVQVEDFTLGYALPSTQTSGVFNQLGNTVYVRAIFGAIADDPGKGTDGTFEFSHDGVTWYKTNGQFQLPGHLRRMGIAVQGQCIAGVEFMRIYTYVPVAVTSTSTATLPGAPLTGSRLFVD